MSGVVKIYGVVVCALVAIFLMINVNTRIFVEEDLFESSRTTQLSTIKESLNLGELFANGNYEIDKTEAIKHWVENFKNNRDSKLNIVVDVIDIHENPPAIAVRLKGYADLMMMEKDLELDYTNIVLLDEKGS